MWRHGPPRGGVCEQAWRRLKRSGEEGAQAQARGGGSRTGPGRGLAAEPVEPRIGGGRGDPGRRRRAGRPRALARVTEQVMVAALRA